MLLYRGDSGKVTAMNDRCPHRGALLSKGRLEGDAVRCMYHGIKYDSTGRCVQSGQDMIPPKLDVRTYPIEERGHLVWIWMGDPAKADPSQIIDFPYLSDPRWKGLPAYLHYDASYLLIVDNLSDFAHLAFVHTKTLAVRRNMPTSPSPIAVERLRARFPGRALAHEQRRHRRFIARSSRTRTTRSTGATWHHVRPRNLLHGALFAPAGTVGKRATSWRGPTVPELSVHDARDSQHDALLLGILNDYEGEDSTISRSLLDSLIEGFMEDKAIIERQQQTLDADPNFQMLAIMADAPLAHFRTRAG